jgi:hypothetical protein
MAGEISPDIALPPPTENTPRENEMENERKKNSVKSYKSNEKIKQK